MDQCLPGDILGPGNDGAHQVYTKRCPEGSTDQTQVPMNARYVSLATELFPLLQRYFYLLNIPSLIKKMT